ncbi:MAG: CRISPR system precrRNA processing endoribonuclease RAMP protein Cas6 [Deferribacteres bacterium]|nr:CRISPR system precrRNA processing endoribonuclease RAMP protein Cas6 [Deferribacteres bacterium]
MAQLVWLPFVSVRAVFKVAEPQALPVKLFSTFRGAFGRALRNISCIARGFKSCLECPLNQKCAYGYLFETPKPQDAEILRKYPIVPHPFIFRVPYPYQREEKLEVRLTLVGDAAEYFPHVVLALTGVGKMGLGPGRVSLSLEGIEDEETGEPLVEQEKIKKPSLISYKKPQVERDITLKFLSPTSLKFSRRLIRPQELEFHMLIRNLIRRISILSYFHAKKPLDIDFKGLIARAESVQVVEKDLRMVRFRRTSARNRSRYALSGFVGSASFSGDLEDFLPFLVMGTYVGVGKNTSFGFGSFEIET